MTDYARVAETLKELKEFYTQPLTPDLECWRVHRTLAAAAALCESVAAPVDEAKEALDNREWRDQLIADGNSPPTQFDAWLARAHSDARAKVAEAWQPIESAPKDRKARLVYVPDNKCIYEVYWDEVRLMWITFGGGCVLPYEPTHWQPLPPPPTVEGERG